MSTEDMKNKSNMGKSPLIDIYHMAYIGMLTSVALAIYIVESWIPVLIPIPGVKLGLANVVTLYIICGRRKKYPEYNTPTRKALDALEVLIMRIILGSIFAGQAISFIYSLCGGFLCLLVVLIINRLLMSGYIYITGIFGALAHNVGQILAACLILQMTGILAYLPYLCISAIITGLFTGLVTHFLVKRI